MDNARLIAALESSSTLDSWGKRAAPLVKRAVSAPDHVEIRRSEQGALRLNPVR